MQPGIHFRAYLPVRCILVPMDRKGSYSSTQCRNTTRSAVPGGYITIASVRSPLTPPLKKKKSSTRKHHAPQKTDTAAHHVRANITLTDHRRRRRRPSGTAGYIPPCHPASCQSR